MPELQLGQRRIWQLRLPIFEGRLFDLVRLITDRRVSPSDIRTADIARQVSEHLARGQTDDLEEVGELAVDVARILLLKSSYLLARPEAEDESDQAVIDMPVSDRSAIVRAAADLRQREGNEGYSPDWRGSPVEQPVAPRNPEVLSKMWRAMTAREVSETAPVAVPAFVRLEVALSGLLRRLKRSATLSLRSVLGNATRKDVVIYFLAVLELARRRQLVPTQDEQFGDISLEYAERATDAVSRAG